MNCPQLLLNLVCYGIFCLSWYGQGESNIWLLRQRGILDFNYTPAQFRTEPKSVLLSEQLKSVVCNSEGGLLFYTDGIDVYDRHFELMPNGTKIGDSESNYIFSSMPVVSIPYPGQASKYYIFTLSNGLFSGFSENYTPGELNYSILDMKLNDGKGDIVDVRKKIFLRGGLSGRLVAAKGKCGDLWIVVREMNSNRFLAYKVTTEGIQDPILSEVGSVLTIPDTLIQLYSQEDGTMFFSPNYDRLALLDNRGLKVELFDFDRSSGRFSNPIALSVAQKTKWVNHGSFSPDGSKLYVIEAYDMANSTNSTTSFADYYQYDLTFQNVDEILRSKTLITKSNRGGYYSQMQLGPDSILYITEEGTLASIKYPNLKGPAATYQDNIFRLPYTAATDARFFTLMNPTVIPDPPSISSMQLLPEDSPICLESSIFLEIEQEVDQIRWQDGSSDARYTVNSPGTYWVDVFRGNCVFTDTIQIQESMLRIDLGPDTLICEGASLELQMDGFSGTVIWHDGSTDDQFLVTEAGTYIATVIDANGCIDQDTISVKVEPCMATQVVIPNAFTPNNDGSNDYFNIVANGPIIKNRIITFRVYNRWGQIVYDNETPDLGWDGRSNGRPAPSDVYFYFIQIKLGEVEELKSWKGDITLIR